MGNLYSNGYSNRMRLFGQLEWVSEETEQVKQNEKVTSSTARSVYNLRPKLVKNQSWALKQLLKSVCRADTVKAKYLGNTYFYDAVQDAVEKGNETSFDWHPNIILRTKAEKLNYYC